MSALLPLAANVYAQSKLTGLLGKATTLTKMKRLQPLLAKSNMARSAANKLQAGAGQVHNLLTQSPMVSSNFAANAKGTAAFMGLNYLSDKLTSPIVQPIAERFARKDIPREYRDQV